ncbi:MAG TPA: hydroxymethylbilane synthase [Lacipirellulaceae bacterium]|nr:hydroxymethylbilane synthase [Lacipirellulaceae bacterium]HMP05957.1 hydroxymethylbilane synthase [Lacipirellulaceae bacterium]
MASTRTFRIGTRGSLLARWQSDWVAARLADCGVAVEIVEIATLGDVRQVGPVAGLGATGVFTKEIQAALVGGKVDLAVHSLKDLPTLGVEGLALAATPPRESPLDALVDAQRRTLATLPEGARVGTGSLRRRAQLLHLRADLEIVPVRGNVETRLRKATDGELDAVVLAAAGLQRLGWGDQIAELLGPPQMLPAPGQGALAIEARRDDAEALAVAATLDDAATRWATTAERSALAALEGGCSAPIAAWGRLSGGRLLLDAVAADADGRRALRASGAIELAERGRAAALEAAAALGQQVAEELRGQGAAELIGLRRPGD